MKLNSLLQGDLNYYAENRSCNKPGMQAVDSSLKLSARQLRLNGHPMFSYRFISERQAVSHRIIWTLKPDFRECFHVYKKLAVGFPLAKGNEEFLSLYYKESDPEDIRIGDSFAGGVSNTFHDIKGYDNLIAFNNPDGLVMAFYHLGLTRRTRLDVLNNQGKHFTFCLNTMAPLEENESYEFLCYVAKDEKFWWQQALEYADAIGIRQNLFRTTVTRLSDHKNPELIILGRTGESVDISVRRRGFLKDAWHVLKAGIRINSDVAHLPLTLRNSASGAYEIKVSSANIVRSTLFIKKPVSGSRADILYVFPTNAWRSYAMNGHYHGPIDHCFPWSYSYSATIMEGVSDIFDDVPPSARYPIQSEYYNNMPPYAKLCSGFIDSIESYCQDENLSWHACGEEDIDDGSVKPENYRLVLLGNHAEYSTPREMLVFKRYLNSGGALIVLGGDAFGRRVDYIKDRKGRILYQKLFHNTVVGHNIKAGEQGLYNYAAYPKSAQYSDAQRLARFGFSYCASPPMLDKTLLTVEDNSHPITRQYRIHEVISESRWECDYVNPDWKILISIKSRNTAEGGMPPIKCAALAIHPKWNLCCLGPMGLNETLAGYYGNKAQIHVLFTNTLKHFLLANRFR